MCRVRLKPRTRAFKSVLFLKAGPVDKSVVYASHRNNALAPLIFGSLHKWSENFIFIRSKTGYRHLDMSGGLD